MNKLTLFAAVCLFLTTLNNLNSQSVPQFINYQGNLVDKNDQPITGNAIILFRIWDDSIATDFSNKIWEEFHPNVFVNSGLFSINLGTENPLPYSVFKSKDVFLEINVNGETLKPRRRIGSVAFAYHASSVQGSQNIFPDSGNVGIGTITPNASLEINGQIKLTGGSPGKGKVLASDEDGLASWQPIETVVSSIPKGIIVMWSGSIEDIPAGWALCDGQNGTPDIRDRFIVGSGGNYSVGRTGGTTKHSHSSGSLQAPSHVHGAGSYKLDTNPSGGANTTLYGVSVTNGKLYFDTGVSNNKPQAKQNVTGSSESGGDGDITGKTSTADNLPPYYALAYIMKL